MPNRMIRVHRTPVGIARRCFFVHMSAGKSICKTRGCY